MCVRDFRLLVSHLVTQVSWAPAPPPAKSGPGPMLSHRMDFDIIKSVHSSTNPENMVKISPVVSENTCLIGRPLKKNFFNVGKT